MTAPQAAIEAIAQEILARMGDERPGVFSPAQWKGKVLARAMADEPFRVALFRFVDVLPAVANDARLLDLAGEYFDDADPEARSALGWTARALGRAAPLRKVAAVALRRQVADLARQFIAGETVDAALPTLKRLWESGCAFSVDLLGEVTLSRAEADAYEKRYLELFSALDAAVATWGPGPGHDEPAVNVSVKLSALDPLLEPHAWDDALERAKAALRPILAAAKERGAHVHVDMEHHDLKDLTLAAVTGLLEEDAFSDGPSCGVVLQAYLTSAEADLDGLLAWARRTGRPVTVRLVKGAYWDQEVVTHAQAGWSVPVWRDKARTDATYEAMAVRLLEHRDVLRPAFGGHNLRTIAHAAATAEALGVGKDGYELQVIHGMAEPLRRALVGEGYRVRAYCPVGAFLPGMAYLVRRLLENTANTSMLRQMYAEAAPAADLLKPPVPGPEPAEAADAVAGGFRNAPHAHFVASGVRDAFADALERVRSTLGGHAPAVIDGRDVDTAERITRHDPSVNGRLVGTAARCGPEEAARAVAGAERAAGEWARTPLAERVAVLGRTAAILRRDRFDLAALEVFEVGKDWTNADADVCEAIDFCVYYARQMTDLGAPRHPGAAYPGEANETGYRPRGVAAVIAPWNFPLAIPTGMTAAALVAGNAVVLKPSERSPMCGARLFAAFREAGVPDGVLQLLPGAGEAGAALAADPGVDLVAFTGSRDVGLAIAQAAAQPGRRGLKHVIAEMGGKNAVIVDETADLDEAVRGIVASAFGYQGQKCSACSRVIAHRAVHDALVERLCAAASSLPIGPAEDPASRMGPLVDDRALEKVRAYVAIGREEAHPALVVEDVPEGGCFAGPAVFTGVAPGHRLFREEVFGPVLAVTQAADLEAAVALANDSDYALTGGLFSRSPAAIETVRARFAVGNLYINRGITGALVGRQPFGGFRLSGVGSQTGGPDYLRPFLLPYAVSENTLRRGFAPGGS
jgi:RHH-type proline utilization regulon transcriptional repressor/proline dehydrogenase/delta 1-pyrroline-5-carboxylate dehydrogenase